MTVNLSHQPQSLFAAEKHYLTAKKKYAADKVICRVLKTVLGSAAPKT